MWVFSLFKDPAIAIFQSLPTVLWFLLRPAVLRRQPVRLQPEAPLPHPAMISP